MKRNLLLLCCAFVLFSCKQEYLVRSFESVSIQKIDMDSTSIRAIHAVNENEMLFAGSRGDIGLTTDGGETWNFDYIKYQDSITKLYFPDDTYN